MNQMRKLREQRGETVSSDEAALSYKGHLFTGTEEKFASARCVSRIAEMRSAHYQSRQHQVDIRAEIYF